MVFPFMTTFEKETETNPQAPPNPHFSEGLLPLVDMISRQEVLSKGKEKGSWSDKGDGSFSLHEFLQMEKPTWGRVIAGGKRDKVQCRFPDHALKWALKSLVSIPLSNGAYRMPNMGLLVNAPY